MVLLRDTMMVLRGVHPVSGRLVPAVWVAATARRVAVAGRAITPFNFGPTITAELANYCGTGGAVCGESDGKNKRTIDSSQLPVCSAASSSVEKKKITTAQATAGAQAETRSPRVTPW